MGTSGRRANQSGDMMDGTDVGMIGIGAGIVGLLIAAMLYKKVDSIEIKNETVAKITGRIQDGAMAFLFAEYRMLSIFIVVVAALLFVGGSYNDDLGINTMIAFIIGALCSVLLVWVLTSLSPLLAQSLQPWLSQLQVLNLVQII